MADQRKKRRRRERAERKEAAQRRVPKRVSSGQPRRRVRHIDAPPRVLETPNFRVEMVYGKGRSARMREALEPLMEAFRQVERSARSALHRPFKKIPIPDFGDRSATKANALVRPQGRKAAGKASLELSRQFQRKQKAALWDAGREGAKRHLERREKLIDRSISRSKTEREKRAKLREKARDSLTGHRDLMATSRKQAALETEKRRKLYKKAFEDLRKKDSVVKVTCKERPDDNTPKRGSGGPRQFIPWCTKSR